MAKRIPFLPVLGIVLFSIWISWGQAIPTAPPVPTCSWDSSGVRSTCKFKDALTGTPTSVAGNRIIVFLRSMIGGHTASRRFLADAVKRLADRYGFTATVTEDPAVFVAESLADAKVVIMGNGEGEVVPPGPNRIALEDFQQVNGWGVIWIHAACDFITVGWPFGRKSCVEGYYRYANGPGTERRMFIDSGNAASPNHGIRNPQSEFLLRQLPGWGGNRALEMADEWYCFRAPARNTQGVNVLFGYDRSSGLPNSGHGDCPDARGNSEAASQDHNMVWMHRMGNGITIYNSWGHDEAAYTKHGNMGDSLLWRFIRYAAKDWCVSGSGEPGSDTPVAVRTAEAASELRALQRNGVLTLNLSGKGRSAVSLMDMSGRQVNRVTVNGQKRLEIPGLRRGMYLMRISEGGKSRTSRIMVYLIAAKMEASMHPLAG